MAGSDVLEAQQRKWFEWVKTVASRFGATKFDFVPWTLKSYNTHSTIQGMDKLEKAETIVGYLKDVNLEVTLIKNAMPSGKPMIRFRVPETVLNKLCR